MWRRMREMIYEPRPARYDRRTSNNAQTNDITFTEEEDGDADAMTGAPNSIAQSQAQKNSVSSPPNFLLGHKPGS